MKGNKIHLLFYSFYDISKVRIAHCQGMSEKEIAMWPFTLLRCLVGQHDWKISYMSGVGQKVPDCNAVAKCNVCGFEKKPAIIHDLTKVEKWTDIGSGLQRGECARCHQTVRREKPAKS